MRSGMWVLVWAWAICVASMVPTAARAQDADIVELTNGGFVRGTILEHLPGDHVTIQLASGEVRTFPAAEVGAVRPAEHPARAARTRPEARVEVTSDLDHLTLHRVTGTSALRHSPLRADTFEILCVLPCTFSIVPGTYELAYASSGDPTPFPEPMELTDGIRLHVRYEDHSQDHLIGGLTMFGGVVVGVGAMLLGIFVPDADPGVRLAVFISGAVIGVAGLIVGGAIAAQRNRVDLVRAGEIRF